MNFGRGEYSSVLYRLFFGSNNNNRTMVTLELWAHLTRREKGDAVNEGRSGKENADEHLMSLPQAVT